MPLLMPGKRLCFVALCPDMVRLTHFTVNNRPIIPPSPAAYLVPDRDRKLVSRRRSMTGDTNF